MDAHKISAPKLPPRCRIAPRPLPALLAAGLLILPGTSAWANDPGQEAYMIRVLSCAGPDARMEVYLPQSIESALSHRLIRAQRRDYRGDACSAIRVDGSFQLRLQDRCGIGMIADGDIKSHLDLIGFRERQPCDPRLAPPHLFQPRCAVYGQRHVAERGEIRGFHGRPL